MATRDILYSKALDAISNVVSDKTSTIREIIESLELIQDEISVYIEALEYDYMAQQGKCND